MSGKNSKNFVLNAVLSVALILSVALVPIVASAVAGYPTQEARPTAVNSVATTEPVAAEPVVSTTAVAPEIPKSEINTPVATPPLIRTTASATSELTKAKSILAGLKRKYKYLKGVTVEFGNAHGYQAISYYQRGRIVISKSHRATLSRILNHEIWHIIDWRDNHKINWGEHLPPKNASHYRR